MIGSLLNNKGIIIFILAGIAILVGINNDLNTGTKPNNTSTTVKPNAFATNATLTEFSPEGTVKLIIETDKSYYFRDDKRIETSGPVIRYTNESNEHLTLNADRGVYNIDTQTIDLQSAVKLRRTNLTGETTLITTHDLSIDTKNDFISTEQPVNITQGGNTLSSVGLNASMQDRKIELPQRVRGTYDLAN